MIIVALQHHNIHDLNESKTPLDTLFCPQINALQYAVSFGCRLGGNIHPFLELKSTLPPVELQRPLLLRPFFWTYSQ